MKEHEIYGLWATKWMIKKAANGYSSLNRGVNLCYYSSQVPGKL